MTENNNEKNNITERPPIVAVMGHIDHGKSALLDYIRKSNIVAKEAGGITQHISAYEVVHKNLDGKNKKITFLDTPGHAAFSAMRTRGASIADVAILVVSAEEGPKTQTLEALKSITETRTPFVVAINKIDRPEANIERTKQQLMEKEIYLEGYGGNIPFAPISAKTGAGINELLETVLLIAEMEELKGDREKEASGFVLEANLDSKKGICSTLVIKNGSLRTGEYIVCEKNFAPIRIMEDFLGENIKEAFFSSPVRVIGFKEIPSVGSYFESFKTKKEAEKQSEENALLKEETKKEKEKNDTEKITIPLIVKTDVSGSLEAICHEIKKIKSERVSLKIIHSGSGNISENDIQTAGVNTNAVVLGFNVKIDRTAKDLAEKIKISVGIFDIIYKLTEWLEEEVAKRTPKIKTEKIVGRAKILKFFSQTKDKQVVGGKVLEGHISVKNKIKIIRRENEIEKGIIVGLQTQKIEAKEVKEGEEFGAMIDAKKEIAPGDIIESFIVVEE